MDTVIVQLTALPPISFQSSWSALNSYLIPHSLIQSHTHSLTHLLTHLGCPQCSSTDTGSRPMHNKIRRHPIWLHRGQPNI